MDIFNFKYFAIGEALVNPMATDNSGSQQLSRAAITITILQILLYTKMGKSMSMYTEAKLIFWVV